MSTVFVKIKNYYSQRRGPLNHGKISRAHSNPAPEKI
jgi:hypothetical protein